MTHSLLHRVFITTSVLSNFAAISKAHFSGAYRLRHAELQAAGAASAQVTIESLLAELEAARAKATISELEEARAKATDLNQLSAAVRATAEKALILRRPGAWQLVKRIMELVRPGGNSWI